MKLQRRQVLIAGVVGVAGILTGCSSPRRTSPLSTVGADGQFLVMVGDSITVASQSALSAMYASQGFVGSIINAEIGRHIDVPGGMFDTAAGTAIVDYVVASGSLPAVWVLALGTNDLGMYADDTAYRTVIDGMLARLPSGAPLVWVNTYTTDRVPDAERFNLLLRTSLQTRGNAVVGEWFQQCSKSKGELLSDGIHPTDQGVAVFVDVVRAALTELLG